MESRKPNAAHLTSHNTLLGSTSAGFLVRIGACLVLAGLMAGVFLVGSTASSLERSQAAAPGNQSAREDSRTASSARGISTILRVPKGEAFLPVPTDSPETIETFAVDCTTPRTTFILGETVCAKTTFVTETDRWVNWLSPPDSHVAYGSLTNTHITTNAAQDFLYTPTVTGLWKATIADPMDSSIGDPAVFTVVNQTAAIATYAPGCVTPKTVFALGQAVCAKLINGPLGSRPTQILRRLNIVNPGGIVLSQANVTADPQTLTFTLPSTPTSVFGGITVDNRGSWEVDSVSTATGGVTDSASFQVTDPASAVADLSLKDYVFGTGNVPAGNDVTFSVYVINYGPDAAANVSVTADVPANTTFASEASSNLGFSCVNPSGGGTGTSTCTIASLPTGSDVLFDFTYHVSSGAAPGSQILHTSSISTTTAQRSTGATTASAEAFVTQADPTDVCLLSCPADIVVTADTTQAGQPGAFVTYSAASVQSGSCGSVSNSPQSGSFFAVTGSPHTVTSNSSAGPSCTFTVTVLNTAPPTISCPGAVTVTAASGADTANVNPGTPTFTPSGATLVGLRSDNKTATYDDDGNVVTPPVIIPLTDPYALGTTGIQWTVTDAGGRKASCSQTIFVQAAARDPLTITCPANVTTTAPSGSCQATVSVGTPTTNPSDSHVTVRGVRSDGQPMYDCDVNGENCTRKSPDLPFPAGVTTVTWTATDDVNDSVASCTQTVTVNGNDTTPPTLHLPDIDGDESNGVNPNISVTTSSCSATLDDELGVATAEDNCTPSVNVVRTGVPANFVFPVGTTEIHYAATDASGNTANGTQLVTVHENTPPTFTFVPADVGPINTGSGATSCGTFVGDATLGTATVSDNCDATVIRSGVPAGNIFPVGDTVITYTAKADITVTRTQHVTVVDNTPPSITCPANISIVDNVPGYCGASLNPGTPTTSDNCGIKSVAGVRSDSKALTDLYPVGTTTITWTATDNSNNTTSCTQGVNVTNPAPTVTITGPVTPQAVNTPVNFTATFTDNAGDTHTAVWTFDGSPQAGTVNEVLHTITTTHTFTTVGYHAVTLTVTDDCGQTATASTSVLIYAFATATGSFVIGNGNAAVGTQVTFWGAQWASLNSLSGGSAPSSFKGFASNASSTPPNCGGTWTTGPGNSSNPPGSIPAYLGVFVSSSITKSGSTISGNIPKMVVVQTNPGYASNPGHAGTGTVVAVICP